LAALLAIAPVADAEAHPQLESIVILRPVDLPQAAQTPGQSIKLFALTNGRTYLYIEQQQLGRLVILDVTDPA
jgi:hypothetical protein